MGAMRGLPALRALHAYQKLGYSASIRRAQAHTASSGARTNLDGPEQMPKQRQRQPSFPAQDRSFPRGSAQLSTNDAQPQGKELPAEADGRPAITRKMSRTKSAMARSLNRVAACSAGHS